MVDKSSKPIREIMEDVEEDDMYILNEREKEVVKMRSGQRTGEVMRYREIGEALDIRPQEARVYAQSALKKLEKHLKSKEVYW